MPDGEITEAVAFDAAQEAVINAPVQERLLVVAGPGTGKTRTLLARAEYLIDHEGLEQAFDLTILSFSRAAVQTVARRLAADTDLGRLPVVTIDSLASRVLFECGVSVSGLDYEGRIVAACELLGGDRRELADLLPARHVLVDEAQDVIGIRAVFVHALLAYVCRSPEAGFTVFGDTAQAIYDFQARSASPPRLIELLVDDGLGVSEIELETNYRMQDPRLVEIAARFGAALRSTDGGRSWSEVRREIAAEIALDAGWLHADDAPNEVRSVIERLGSPRVAVLTRSNVETLRVGAKLQRAGLDVAVQHRLQERGGAPWLALLFGVEPFNEVPVPSESTLDGVPPWCVPPPDLGRVLRDARVVRSKTVDLRRLSALLRCGACPEELVVRRDAAVTVSTIHQAKGLEFDTVYVVENDRGNDEEGVEEARVLYVAATRARDDLMSGAALQSQGPTVTLSDDRSGVGNWGRSRKCDWIEVKVSDSDPEWAPPEREEFDRLQEFLARRCSAGDQARLDLRHGSRKSEPLYDIVHVSAEKVETIVGRTDATFGRVLSIHASGGPPMQVTGLVFDIPDTAVLGSADARRLGLGEHGLHLRARVYGLPWVRS